MSHVTITAGCLDDEIFLTGPFILYDIESMLTKRNLSPQINIPKEKFVCF
jgi:hypothetical protein